MTPWPIAELVPHSGSALLIDDVVSFDSVGLKATSTIKPGGLYSQADGSLPAWLGLEIMAQAVAAWAGCQARAQGHAVKLGFLLGTRRYECHVDSFPAGSRLHVRVACAMRDDAGMGTFACDIEQDGQVLATARINAYSPPNVNEFIYEETPAP
ncbi:MAG TPA: hotdog family protein [Candidimonas sp.]|nr:hotdog family protein [Candidimonas sp.]